MMRKVSMPFLSGVESLLAHEADGFVAGRSFRSHAHIRLVGDELSEPTSDDRVIVGYQHSNHRLPVGTVKIAPERTL
jgi:hypothetical protein